jgi:hypothetical protein
MQPYTEEWMVKPKNKSLSKLLISDKRINKLISKSKELESDSLTNNPKLWWESTPEMFLNANNVSKTEISKLWS